MLKSLNLQDTRIDFQSPMLDQSRSIESPRVSTSTPQLPAPKERRRSSVARAQTLETQVKDLGGQVQDLGRQLKTMGSQVQAIVAHVQHFPTQTGGLDDRDWLETKDLALLTQEKGQTGPTKGKRDSKPVFQVGVRAVRPLQAALQRPAPRLSFRDSFLGGVPEPGARRQAWDGQAQARSPTARFLPCRAPSCSRTSWKT